MTKKSSTGSDQEELQVDKRLKPSNKPPGKKQTNWMKNIGFVIVLAIFGGIAWVSSQDSGTKLKDVPLSEVISRANKGELDSLVVTGEGGSYGTCLARC